MTTIQVWNQYHLDIKNFIFSKVKDEQVSNDILQDTFLKIHTKLSTIKNPDKIKSWVFSIANNTVYDYFRRNNIVLDYNENKDNIDALPSEHDEKDCLYGIIKSLPKKYRDPIFLSDIKGMKHSEIATQLHLNLSTIKSQIQRARKLIKTGYIECCDFKINEKGFLVGEIKDKKDCKICS